MDRQIVFPSAIPLETDILSTNKFAMVGLGYALLDLLGSSQIAGGFACTPTGPPSLNVAIAAGRIYSLQNVDNSAYGDLSADTTHQILKQGILADAIQLSCPAPTTAGDSINYLIEAAYSDSDTTPVVLNYYNASNPADPFSGPGNDGSPNNTVRSGIVTVTAKAGIPAATGSQTTPSLDSGNIALYVVTVAYGATTIVSDNIAVALGANFITGGFGSFLTSAVAAATYLTIANAASTYATQTNATNATNLTSGTVNTARLPSAITISGAMTAGSFNVSSDERLKKNISPIPDALAKLAKLNGVTFQWKDGGIQAAGIIAQDLFKVLPQSVGQANRTHEGKVGSYLTVDPAGVIALLIESVKTLAAKNEALEARIAGLEAAVL